MGLYMNKPSLNPDPCDAIEGYQSLFNRYPDHNMIRFMLAGFEVDCYKSKVGQSGRAKYVPILDAGVGHLKALAERLEPNAALPHATLCSLAYYLKDFNLAAKELKDVARLMAKPEQSFLPDRRYFTKLIEIGCALGERDAVAKLVNSFKSFAERTWTETLIGALNSHMADIYIADMQKPPSVDELKARVGVVEDVLSQLCSAGVNKSKVEMIRMRHAAFLLIVSERDKQIPTRMLKDISFEDGSRCAQFAEIVEHVFAQPLIRSAGNKGALKIARSAADYLNGILPPGQKRALLPALTATALMAYAIGDVSVGDEYMRRAFRIDSKEARRIYTDEACLFLRRESAGGWAALDDAEGEGSKRFDEEWRDPHNVPLDLRAPVAKLLRHLAVGHEAARENAPKSEALQKAAALERLALLHSNKK